MTAHTFSFQLKGGYDFNWNDEPSSLTLLITGSSKSGKTLLASQLGDGNVLVECLERVKQQPERIIAETSFRLVRLSLRCGHRRKDSLLEWSSVLAQTAALIYVVDSTFKDEADWAAAKEGLLQILSDSEFSKRPVLVLATKADHPRAVLASRVIDELKLGAISERDVRMKRCCLGSSANGRQSTDPRLASGIVWLLSVVLRDVDTVRAVVERDTKLVQSQLELRSRALQNTTLHDTLCNRPPPLPATEPNVQSQLDRPRDGRKSAFVAVKGNTLVGRLHVTVIEAAWVPSGSATWSCPSGPDGTKPDDAWLRQFGPITCVLTMSGPTDGDVIQYLATEEKPSDCLIWSQQFALQLPEACSPLMIRVYHRTPETNPRAKQRKPRFSLIGSCHISPRPLRSELPCDWWVPISPVAIRQTVYWGRVDNVPTDSVVNDVGTLTVSRKLALPSSPTKDRPSPPAEAPVAHHDPNSGIQVPNAPERSAEGAGPAAQPSPELSRKRPGRPSSGARDLPSARSDRRDGHADSDSDSDSLGSLCSAAQLQTEATKVPVFDVGATAAGAAAVPKLEDDPQEEGRRRSPPSGGYQLQLHLNLHLTFIQGTLWVRVMEAEDVGKRLWIGNIQGYRTQRVRLIAGSEVSATTLVAANFSKTLAWNQELALDIRDAVDAISVHLVDTDVFGEEELLGAVDVPISDLASLTQVDRWLQLRLRNRPAGRVHVAFCYTPVPLSKTMREGRDWGAVSIQRMYRGHLARKLVSLMKQITVGRELCGLAQRAYQWATMQFWDWEPEWMHRQRQANPHAYSGWNFLVKPQVPSTSRVFSTASACSGNKSSKSTLAPSESSKKSIATEDTDEWGQAKDDVFRMYKTFGMNTRHLADWMVDKYRSEWDRIDREMVARALDHPGHLMAQRGKERFEWITDEDLKEWLSIDDADDDDVEPPPWGDVEPSLQEVREMLSLWLDDGSVRDRPLPPAGQPALPDGDADTGGDGIRPVEKKFLKQLARRHTVQRLGLGQTPDAFNSTPGLLRSHSAAQQHFPTQHKALGFPIASNPAISHRAAPAPPPLPAPPNLAPGWPSGVSPPGGQAPWPSAAFSSLGRGRIPIQAAGFDAGYAAGYAAALSSQGHNMALRPGYGPPGFDPFKPPSFPSGMDHHASSNGAGSWEAGRLSPSYSQYSPDMRSLQDQRRARPGPGGVRSGWIGEAHDDPRAYGGDSMYGSGWQGYGGAAGPGAQEQYFGDGPGAGQQMYSGDGGGQRPYGGASGGGQDFHGAGVAGTDQWTADNGRRMSSRWDLSSRADGTSAYGGEAGGQRKYSRKELKQLFRQFGKRNKKVTVVAPNGPSPDSESEPGLAGEGEDANPFADDPAYRRMVSALNSGRSSGPAPGQSKTQPTLPVPAALHQLQGRSQSQSSAAKMPVIPEDSTELEVDTFGADPLFNRLRAAVGVDDVTHAAVVSQRRELPASTRAEVADKLAIRRRVEAQRKQSVADSLSQSWG